VDKLDIFGVGACRRQAGFSPIGVLVRSLIANMMSPPHLHSEQ
jgi:hypothetical protein